MQLDQDGRFAGTFSLPFRQRVKPVAGYSGILRPSGCCLVFRETANLYAHDKRQPDRMLGAAVFVVRLVRNESIVLSECGIVRLWYFEP